MKRDCLETERVERLLGFIKDKALTAEAGFIEWTYYFMKPSSSTVDSRSRNVLLLLL